MGWIGAIIGLIQLVPSAVSLFKQIVDAIKGHPQGSTAGVAAVQKHMDTFGMINEVGLKGD